MIPINLKKTIRWACSLTLVAVFYCLYAVCFRVNPVAVELFVMSKCPDAKYCEATFADVCMKKVRVKNLPVHLNFSYIAQEDYEGELSCMHGKGECIGNMQQLCMQFHNHDQALPFILCQNKNQNDIPSNAIECGFSYFDCLSTIGKDLLRESTARATRLGIVSSCTVVIAGKKVCVRDNNQWKECPGGGEVDDFVKRIEQASKA